MLTSALLMCHLSFLDVLNAKMTEGVKILMLQRIQVATHNHPHIKTWNKSQK